MSWFKETLFDDYGQEFSIDRMLFQNQTDHHKLSIFKNDKFGRVLALDGVIQTTEADEFFYHEMMTHVPIMAHKNPKDVLVIGGGDGGILRELTKHSMIDNITQVEIDEDVITMCCKYLPKHSMGAFDDNRVKIKISDGLTFVSETNQKFDVIISDSTDPIGPGEVLFSEMFYRSCNEILNEGGIFVAQNGVPFLQPNELQNTKQQLSSIFKKSGFYTVAVPTYIGGVMTIAWGSNSLDPASLSIDQLQGRLQKSGAYTRYYNNEIHNAAFVLPNYIRRELD